MPQITSHPVADFVTTLLPALREFEGNRSEPYFDDAKANAAGEYQHVTIGDGINIDWSNGGQLRLVLARLGLVESSALVEDPAKGVRVI